MIIIGRRLGALVPLVGIFALFFGLFVFSLVPESWFGDDEAYQRFAFDGAFIFGCLCIYVCGKRLNDPRQLAVYQVEEEPSIHGIEALAKPDEKNRVEDEVEMQPTHTFFFIRFEYWGVIFAVLYFWLSYFI